MSLFLDKGFGMYSDSHPRHLAQTLGSQYLPFPSSYGDVVSGDHHHYHHHHPHHHHHQFPETGEPLCGPPTAAAWSRVTYAAPRDDWSTPAHGFPGSSPGAGQAAYETPGFVGVVGRGSPPNPARSKSYEWIRDGGHRVSGGNGAGADADAEHRSVPTNDDAQLSEGRTRTKDKYRVVYSDHQRLELEKEFQYSRYITIRKKAQLSLELNLSGRQVKIWFQNRRAKERKLSRRKQQLPQQASATSPALEGADSDPPRSDLSGATTPVASMAVKEEH
ncbi:unnamed protein product [Merluccius merluccius]